MMRSIFSTMSMLSGCREVPLSVALCCHQKIFDQARFVVGMPQVTQAEICPRLFGLLEILRILIGLPQMMDHDHVMPLDWKCFCSLGIHRANFPVVQTKSHMQTKLC